MPPSEAVRALLAGVVDYAGLFPPAALDMPRAVAQYTAHRRGPDAWALGRFVVPLTRLEELVDAAGQPALDEAREPWHLSVLAELGLDVSGRVRDFNARHAPRYAVDSLETKLTAGPAAEALLRRLVEEGAELEVFVEIPIDEDPDDLVRTIKRAGAKAKVRTGGVKPEMFPTSRHLARFIMRCAEHAVTFKATAGLHHPLRARYPLTYEPGAAQGMMFGFLNVFLAAALLRANCITTEPEIVEVLESSDARDLQLDDAGATWRGRRVTVAQLRDARSSAALSFGSCSFQEPVDDLRTLGLL